MKWILPLTIAVFSVLVNGEVTAQSSSTPPCRARTLDLRALALESGFSGVTCGSSFAKAKQKGIKTMSVPPDTVDGCTQWFGLGRSLNENEEWSRSYDTLQTFVHTCPTNTWTPGAFSIMSSDVQEGGNGPYPGCWPPFKEWLLSALAWNPGNAQYFCADVQALAGALTSDTEEQDTSYSQINTGTNQSMSVLYWILHNPLCTNSSDEQLYEQSRGSQIREWLDTQDTSKVPLDTTIYTMQELGLDSVLKYAALLGVNEGNAPSIISNATAYPNPTGEGTVISFGVSREAYVSIGLFDILGHEVSSPSFGGVVESGNLSVPLSLQGLPSGTYFARIMTTYGEVQTIKLVKE